MSLCCSFLQLWVCLCKFTNARLQLFNVKMPSGFHKSWTAASMPTFRQLFKNPKKNIYKKKKDSSPLSSSFCLLFFSGSTYANCSTSQLRKKLTSSEILAKLSPHEYFTLEYLSEKHAHELNPSFKRRRNEAALKAHHQPAQGKSVSQITLLLSITKKRSDWPRH